jgi:hypothetical protein
MQNVISKMVDMMAEDRIAARATDAKIEQIGGMLTDVCSMLRQVVNGEFMDLGIPVDTVDQLQQLERNLAADNFSMRLVSE